MADLVKIFCKNNNEYYDFEAGITPVEVFDKAKIRLANRLAGVRINNVSRALNFRCYEPKTLEFIDISDLSGMRSYVRSLCFVLSKAVNDLFPDKKIYIEHPVAGGYFCHLEPNSEITDNTVRSIKTRMQEIIRADLPFEIRSAPTKEVVELFRRNGMKDKALLLETSGRVYAHYHLLDGHIDYYYGALLPSTSWIYLFDIRQYAGGLLLQIPDRDNPAEIKPFLRQDKMMSVFNELLDYQKSLQVCNVGDLNLANKRGEISNLVKVSEAIQERKIASIADEIANRYNSGVRVILISGPSSSGKTTFCKRLHIELMVNALRPVNISLDDYYVNRKDTPLDENGEYDYESFFAIDLKTFNYDLKRLLAGEEVDLPTYDFVLGQRVYKGNKVRLSKNSVIVMEGIHALNPMLLPDIPAEAKYRIYVSALTTISLDDHNWIPTSDNRLIRRIIRDYQFRNYSARETISRWESVRRGEDKWIFPYQEEADAMFNSAMLYELAALRRSAEPILTEVSPDTPEYAEAYRLLKFLNYFIYINIDELPNTSLLREFLGGSSFKY